MSNPTSRSNQRPPRANTAKNSLTSMSGRSLPGQKTIGQMLSELGVSGTKNFAGILTDEYLPALSFYNAPTVFNQMRRGDATIAALLAAYKMPLRAAKWYIQPVDESPDSLQMADFLHDNLWGFGTQTFDDFLREALTFLDFGFSWFEKVFDYMDDDPWKDKIGWSKFAFRYQVTRFRYNTKLVIGPRGTKHRELVTVAQFAPPDYQIVDIPVEKLFLLSHLKEGDNYDGISLLRAAYKHWYIKDKLYALQAIGLERSAVGVPYAKYLQHVDVATINTITQMLENLRVDDQASIQFDGSEVEIGYLINKFAADALHQAIEHHDTEIMKSGLAQFVNLGTRSTGATGSYALSQDQSQMFLDALNGEANYFGSAFHLQCTQQLMEWNFNNVRRIMIPRLSHGDIGERSSVKLAQALNAFAQYGFVTPDPHTENVIREFLDLPPRDEEWRLMQIQQALIQEPFPEGENPVSADQTPIPNPAAMNGINPAGVPQTGGNGIGAGIKGGTGKQFGNKQNAGQRNRSLGNAQIAQRQRGGLAASERNKDREKALETFLGEIQNLKSDAMNWKPERPSNRAARLRQPYTIRGTL